MTAGLDDITALALFARVVEARSFTEAGRRLGLSKSAVSTRLRGLEEKLGVRLLHRTTRRLSLTDAGVDLYQRASRMVAAADEAAHTAASSSREPRGTLRLSAPMSFAQNQLAAALPEFLAAFPEVTIDLVADDRVVDLAEGRFDLAVRVQIYPARDSALVHRKLAEDRLVLCAAPAYLEARGTPRSPADLLEHNCLRYSQLPRGGEWRFRGAQGAYSLPVAGNLISSDGAILRRAALAGLGITALPGFMVDGDVAAGRLVPVLERHRRFEFAIYAVYLHRQLPAHARALLEFLARRWSRGLS